MTNNSFRQVEEEKRKICHVISAITDEDHVETNAFTDSKIKMSLMATHPNEPAHRELDLVKVTSKTIQK